MQVKLIIKGGGDGNSPTSFHVCITQERHITRAVSYVVVRKMLTCDFNRRYFKCFCQLKVKLLIFN